MPAGHSAGGVAVLICSPLGHDALLAHCSLRVLADDLAAAGYPTLRFDYPGTGDSCDEGIERAGGHWNAWRQSVDQAAAWLRGASGAERLVVCGLRAGALFATLAAAERHDVDGLILLAPVLRGRSYLRQLFIEAQIKTGRPTPPSVGLDIREFRFAPATVTQIGGIDLREAALRPGQKIAVFAQADSRLTTECEQAWSESGVEIANFGWDGLEPLLRSNIIEEDQLADTGSIIAWLSAAVPARPGPAPAGAVIPPVAELRPTGCVEVPLRFGAGRRLFGVLCLPVRGRADTAVIIVNGGRDPHYGASRHAVFLARRLTEMGIASLRMDFAGLGDSPGPPGQERVLSHMFALSRIGDIGAALDALQELGFRRFAVQGLCAGAFHAFHAALADPRLSVLLLINMPLFTVPGVGALDYLSWREMSPAVFLRKLPRWSSWMNLIQRRHALGAILRVQAARLRATALARIKGFGNRVGVASEPSFAQRSLALLSARNVRTLFLFSREAGDMDAFRQEFGDFSKARARYPGTECRVVGELDHDLSLADGREVAETVMMRFLGVAEAARPDGEPLQTDKAVA